MQPIERYGLVTLLFLIVAVVAVLAWDGPEASEVDEQVALLEEQAAADADRTSTTAPARPKGGASASERWNASERASRTDGTGSANLAANRAANGAANSGRSATDRSSTAQAGGATYNPFGGAPAKEQDVAVVDDAVGATTAPDGSIDRTGATERRAGRGLADGLGGVPAAPADPLVNGLAPSVSGLANAGSNAASRTNARRDGTGSLVDDRSRTANRETERAAERAATAGAPTTTATLPTGALVVESSLSKQLAREYGSDYSLYGGSGLLPAFEDANPGVNMDRLHVGDTLRRPSPQRIAQARKGFASSSVAANTADDSGARGTRGAGSNTPPAPIGGAVRYTIRPNDTLSGIAFRTLGSSNAYPRIEALNPGLEPTRLVVGSTILLPAGANADAPARATATVADASRPSSTSDDRPRIR